MKIFNKIAWTMIVVLTVFLSACWLHGMVKAERGAKGESMGNVLSAAYDVIEIALATPERALQLDNQGPDITFDTEDSLDWTTLDATEPNIIWAITDYGDITQFYDIVFCLDNVEVKFKMTEGKFDVIYDPNDCTAAANTFFVCMKPYLQGMIMEKAKELAATQ